MNRVALQQQIARLNHGIHVCSFYNNVEEQASTMAAWFKEGLSRGEACVYVVDESSEAQVVKALGAAGINVPRERQRGSLVLLSKWDWRHGGPFSPTIMASRVQGIVGTTLSRGFSGAWVAVEMAWTKSPDLDGETVARWEGMWNDLLVGLPVVLLCMYDRTQFAPEFLRPELEVHPFLIHDDDLYPSCYYDGVYACPDRNEDRPLDGMLEHVVEHVGGGRVSVTA